MENNRKNTTIVSTGNDRLMDARRKEADIVKTHMPWNGQRGAVLVLTALVMPLMIACTGLVVDVGNLYLQKAQLQNAADAAVLSGAYAKAGGKNQLAASEAVESSIRGNYQTNRNITNFEKASEADDAETIAYESHDETYRVDGENTEGMRVVLHQQVPTYFLRVFGSQFRSMDVNATSKAAYDTKKENSRGIFDYVIFGAKTEYDATNVMSDDENKQSINSVVFRYDKLHAENFQNIEINGKVGANGAIVRQNDNKDYVTLTNNGDAKNPNAFVGSTAYKDQYASMTGATNGRVLAVSKTEAPTDISLDPSNPVTKKIRDYIDTIAKMPAAEKVQKGVYYRPKNGKNTYTQFIPAYDEWGRQNLGVKINSGDATGDERNMRNFRVIITQGNIQLDTDQFDMSEDGDDYAIIISLEGNIRLHNSSKFRGVVYAPEGDVWLDCYAPALGNFIGQTVHVANCSPANRYGKGVVRYSYTDERFTTAGSGKARLID